MSNAVIGGASTPVYVTGGEVTITGGTITITGDVNVVNEPTVQVDDDPALNVAVTNTPAVTISGGSAIIGSVTLDAARTPVYDGFGNIRFSEAHELFTSTEEQSDLQPLKWQGVTSGAGNTITYDSNLNCAVLTAISTGYVVRQTRHYITYQPGRSQNVQMTAILGAVTADADKKIGLFDAANGVGFGVDATSPYVFIRSSVTGSVVTTKLRSADWQDPLNGNGESGVTLTTTNDILYRITFGWQGAGPVQFSIFSGDRWVIFYETSYSNAQTASWAQTARLPMRAEIITTGATNAVLKMICWAVASEGGTFERPAAAFAATRTINTAVPLTTTAVPVLSLRRSSSRFTRRTVELNGVDALISGNTPVGLFQVYYFPPGTANPLTNSTFANAVNANSACDYDVAATAIDLTNGIPIAATYTGGSGQTRVPVEESLTNQFPFTLDISGAGNPTTTNAGGNTAYLCLVATGTQTGGGNPTGIGGLSVSEV